MSAPQPATSAVAVPRIYGIEIDAAHQTKLLELEGALDRGADSILREAAHHGLDIMADVLLRIVPGD